MWFAILGHKWPEYGERKRLAMNGRLAQRAGRAALAALVGFQAHLALDLLRPFKAEVRPRST